MRANCKQLIVALAVIFGVGLGLTTWDLVSVTDNALAHHQPGHGGGKGGGGGGGDDPQPDPDPPVRYEFELIGTFGGTSSVASGLNSYGDIVGRAVDDNGRHRAFLSTVVDGERVLIDLNDLLSEADKDDGVQLTHAHDINDLGQIVGAGRRPIDDPDGGWVSIQFQLTPDVNDGYLLRDLREINAGIFNVWGINLWGEVVGQYSTENRQSHAYRHDPLTDENHFEGLGVLYEDHDFSVPYGINLDGQIAGYSQKNPGYPRAFLFTPGFGMLDLGALRSSRNAVSMAFDLNDDGVVVGAADAGPWNRHAIRWSNGIMEDLGTLGGNRSRALGINNHGDIVGWAHDADGRAHAFLYHDDFGMIKLEDLVNDLPEGFRLNLSNGQINDDRVIIGNNHVPGVGSQAYVLTPVSEQ